ncbi:MAG TPA: T9SS type A sorting domain-containing protein [Bacteroidales bacterium]|nr:T9SS type A sorting domain-containing protein [Bacteroidales bacterium]HOM40195.1 T9SS type A sorting domain-containing protein [Bacteroidales bacterium]HPP91692.1 T9SS type A sorting domain-containing protein [Bacteroidales bacterium]HRR15549.1 T9SS type A sorting domain-containing protein [Bacteroidales bacterium]HRT46844.1 T9SS type A sorting domain-containing protein [Bacteroidales bacterium]
MKSPTFKILALFIISVLSRNGFSQIINISLLKEHPIFYEDPSIKEWASACKIIRGYIQIDKKELGRASAGEETACLGKADNVTVSLGDSGIAVVTFSEPIRNIDGYDFAVFENSFDGQFLELAFVEVSSDSMRWVRFPSISLTPTNIQTGTFGLTDAKNIYNLAGKYRLFYGTPFDLEELRDSAGIDLSSIKYIRIIDAIGCIDDRYASYDALGNKINDPWPTPFPQSGFDLDAVAVLKQVTEINIPEASVPFKIYPNPSTGKIYIDLPGRAMHDVFISDNTGKILSKKRIGDYVNAVNIENFKPGIYFIQIIGNNTRYVTRIVIN